MADTVRKVSYYYTTVANRAGQGVKVLSAFKEAGVNFLAVHAFPDGPRSQLDFFPEHERAFLKAAKAARIKVGPKRTAFLIEGKNRVGALQGVLKKLADSNINATAVDALTSGSRYAALLWVRRDNVRKAARALGAK